MKKSNKKHLQLLPLPKYSSFSSIDFHKSDVTEEVPFVVNGFANNWPAKIGWNPEFFSEKFGQTSVDVVNKDFGSPGATYMKGAQKIPFAEFLQPFSDKKSDLRLFLINLNKKFPELRQDIHIEDVLKLARSVNVSDKISERFIFMFFGCGGSITQMHYDIDHSNVFHVHLYGKKTVTLFPPSESRNLYRHPFTIRSYVNLENPDYVKHPALSKSVGYTTTLEPGDLLFMPSRWWHQFSYEEPSFGVAFRSPASSMLERLSGLSMLVSSTVVDRGMNRIVPNSWFRWKNHRSQRRVE